MFERKFKMFIKAIGFAFFASVIGFSFIAIELVLRFG